MSDEDVPREWVGRWRCLFCDPPDFREFGFHTGKKLDVRRIAGSVQEGVLYHGYDLFGPPGNTLWNDVTHWRVSGECYTDQPIAPTADEWVNDQVC